MMQRYVHSQLVLSASDSSYGNKTLLTGYTSTYGSLKRLQFLLVCMQARFGPPLDNPLQKWLVTVLKRILMVKDTSPSWCVLRECGLEPLLFNWLGAAVRRYNT